MKMILDYMYHVTRDDTYTLVSPVHGAGAFTVNGPGTVYIRMVEDQKERRNPVPRRLVVRLPIADGAVYGNQMVGRREALVDRRITDGVRPFVIPDSCVDRRIATKQRRRRYSK